MNPKHLQKDITTVFGFWIYLMTDFVLFATLFATYAVLRGGTAGGPGPADLFDGPFVLLETLVLLMSSFYCGMAFLAAHRGNARAVIWQLCVTGALGLAFVALEFSEFVRLIAEGNGPHRSAFLSSYFTLVGTHGLHIMVGLVWLLALIVAITRSGLTRSTTRKLLLWSIFWHFLDLIWICIFTIVYLFGLL